MGSYANPEVKLIDQSRSQIGKGIADASAAFGTAYAKGMAARNKQMADLNTSVNNWAKAYDKEIKQEKKAALGDIAEMEDNENKKEVNTTLTQAFADGRDKIVAAVKAGKSQSEIQAIFDEQVSEAEEFALSIHGLHEVSTGVTNAINKAREGDNPGTADGSIFVGDPTYANIFDLYGGGQGTMDKGWSDVKVMKRPDGEGDWDYVTWVDKNGDGEFDETEAVDFRAVSKTWQAGKEDELYTKIQNDDKSVAVVQRQLKGDNGINSDTYREEGVNIIVEDGVVTTQKVDKPDYDRINSDLWTEGAVGIFSDNAADLPAGYAGSTSQAIDKAISNYGGGDMSKGVKKYYQKYFGMDAATEFITKLNNEDPKSDKYKEILIEGYNAVKSGYINNNVLSTIKGVNVNNRSRILNQGRSTTRTTENKARVDGIVDAMNDEQNYMNDIYSNLNVHGGGAIVDPVKNKKFAEEMELRLVGGGFKNQGGDAIGHVDGVKAGQWKYDPGSGAWSMVPGTEGTHVTIIGDVSSQKSSTQIVTIENNNYSSEIARGVTRSMYKTENDLDIVKKLKVTNGIYDGSGVKFKSTTSTSVSVPPSPVNNISTDDDENARTNVGTNPLGSTGINTPTINTGLNYGSNATVDASANTVTFDFNGLGVDSSKSYGGYPVMAMSTSPDPKYGESQNYIRQMGNFETLAGNANGGGVKGYGFSGANPALAKLFKNAKGNNKEQKFINSVNDYIIGQDSGKAEYGGKKTILTDLGISRADFDALPEGVKKELVDWKFNSGRGTTDLVLIAGGGDWDGTRAFTSNSPKSDELEVNGVKIDLKNLDVAKLRQARQDLYTGRIDGLKAGIAKFNQDPTKGFDPNGKPASANGPNDPTYAEILEFAEDGYNNSQQYR
jgi:hypothetical protein